MVRGSLLTNVTQSNPGVDAIQGLSCWVFFPFLPFLYPKFSSNQYIKHSAIKKKFGYKMSTSALYVYCSLKTVQEQALRCRSIKLTCHRYFNFLSFDQVTVLTK